MTKNENLKGLGLIETLVALTIAIIVIVSLVSLSNYSLRSSQKSKDLFEATKRASDQIELLRAYRDNNFWSTSTTGFWDSLLPCDAATPCRVSTSGGVFSVTSVSAAAPTTVGVYNAYFYATNPDGTDLTSTRLAILRVNVVVKYLSGQTYNYTDLSNWKGN